MMETLVWTPQKCPNCKKEADWVKNTPLRCPKCLEDFCLDCAKIQGETTVCPHCDYRSRLPKSVVETLAENKQGKKESST